MYLLLYSWEYILAGFKENVIIRANSCRLDSFGKN